MLERSQLISNQINIAQKNTMSSRFVVSFDPAYFKMGTVVVEYSETSQEAPILRDLALLDLFENQHIPQKAVNALSLAAPFQQTMNIWLQRNHYLLCSVFPCSSITVVIENQPHMFASSNNHNNTKVRCVSDYLIYFFTSLGIKYPHLHIEICMMVPLMKFKSYPTTLLPELELPKSRLTRPQLKALAVKRVSYLFDQCTQPNPPQILKISTELNNRFRELKEKADVSDALLQVFNVQYCLELHRKKGEKVQLKSTASSSRKKCKF